MVVVYTLLDLDRERAFANVAIETLPAAYRDRVARMQSLSARARTCAGLQLLAAGLTRTGGQADTLERIGRNADGRPAIAGGPSFSISHSGALVGCALSWEQSVGLDIEQRRRNISTRLAQRIQRGQRADSALDFFDAWCTREAVVKASGRVGLARIQAVELASGAQGDAQKTAQLDGQTWFVSSPALEPGYAAVIASDDAIGAVDLLKISAAPMSAG